ncbi:MAG: ATP-dependent helicase [Terriglobales bacterium]
MAAIAPARLSALNPQQRAAVEHVSGPLLILAGAGSGKTRVLTHRIVHLIAHYRTPPQSILAMTFTNKAAQEMQQRVAALLDYEAWAQPEISTFHAFCVRSLRRDYAAIGGRTDFVIYADDEQLRLLKTVLSGLGLDEKAFAPRAVLSRIGTAKNRGWSPQQLREHAADPNSERLAVVYERYQAGLKLAHALDFDDLLLETERLLRQSEETAARYNQRYRYLLVDEYQDTNRPQYELLRLLTHQTQNLCVVGDEDQSIYSWRGADIRNILDFERDYAGARVIRLEQNYRSTKNILTAASSVVANNRERKGKQLWTEAAPGAAIACCQAPDSEQEAAWVADAIAARLAAAPPPAIAVLYRTNAQSRLFEEALRRRGIAYRVLGGFSFYERAEVRDLLAYLRAALNPADSMAWLRIINTPARGIGKTTVEALERLMRERNATCLEAAAAALEGGAGFSPRALRPLAAFYQLMAELRTLALAAAPPDALLRQALERSGYLQRLREEATPEAEAHLENLGELVNAAADAAARGESAAAFLDHAALVSDQDGYDEQARVQLMSLHAAKGLEFDSVFLAGLEEGLFPHSRTLNSPAALEEERRLCYVGMTRARRELALTHAARRRRFGGQSYEPSVPSRFLAEVPAALLDDQSPVELRPSTPGWERGGLKPSGAGFRHTYNSVESIHQFFRHPGPAGRPEPPAGELTAEHARGRPQPVVAPAAAVSSGSRWHAGARVRHASFGVGTVLQIEGEGEHTKLTISFPGFGLRKLLEKVAGLVPV